MRRSSTVIAMALAMIGLPLAVDGATAQTAAPVVAASAARASDVSAQARTTRPPTRLRVYPRYAPDSDGVYPRYFPGRNAVRDCTATYVEEYRPSGTVITPRMNCYWRRG